MAEIDPDLRAAIAAYLSNAVADVPLPELGEGGFEQLVDMLAQGELAEMFRTLHAQLGRYPTFEDLKHGGMSMG